MMLCHMLYYKIIMFHTSRRPLHMLNPTYFTNFTHSLYIKPYIISHVIPTIFRWLPPQDQHPTQLLINSIYGP
jgi:hypothetical protein